MYAVTVHARHAAASIRGLGHSVRTLSALVPQSASEVSVTDRSKPVLSAKARRHSDLVASLAFSVGTGPVRSPLRMDGLKAKRFSARFRR